MCARMRGSLIAVVLAICSSAVAQTPSSSDPQAVSYAAKAIMALTGGATLKDVTLAGYVIWNVGIPDSGTATFKAITNGESRLDLVLTKGKRTEIRDGQTGSPLGKWINPDTASGHFAVQNCWTDAAWFFPALGSLAAGQNIVFSYIGLETRNGIAVQHIQSHQVVVVAGKPSGPSPQQLSTMDFYLDATTFLPTALEFKSHPDNDLLTNLSVEIDFSTYQSIGGIMVPMHIQKYQQGNLMLDFAVTGASFNSGLSPSVFAIN